MKKKCRDGRGEPVARADFSRSFNSDEGIAWRLAACVMSNDIWSAKGGADRSRTISPVIARVHSCTYRPDHGPLARFCTLKHAHISDLIRLTGDDFH